MGDFDLSGFKTFPPGQLVGDGRYSAPDYWLIDFAQLQPSKGDLWSLGILMYELKYYGKVFNLQGEDLSKTSTSNIQSKYEEFIASIQEIADRSNPLDALFLDLIQIDPDKRPSAAEVVERITNLKPDHFMPCFEVNCEPVLKQMNNEYEMSPSVTASDASLVREEQPIHSTKQQSNLKIMGQNGYYTFQ